MKHDTGLPHVLAGPVLRHVQEDCLLLWLVTTRSTQWCFRLRRADNSLVDRTLSGSEQTELPIGRHAFVQLLNITTEEPWPQDALLHYDLAYREKKSWHWINDWAPHLCQPTESSPHLVIQSHITRILHGSCRKPHHPSDDGLRRVDAEILACGTHAEQRPALLMMTGDQVYADDVAGPMLVAIHRLIERLGLFDEPLEGATVDDSQALYRADGTYYCRQQLLPDIEGGDELRKRFFGGVRKPVFTSANAYNHLMTFSEVMAMYLLVWSPTPWRLIEVTPPSLSDDNREVFDDEARVIADFVASLPRAARVMAQLPTLMIFDDHDVTDDWNLTADWERSAYGHPFSRRIIGNALLAYLLCQGWGNDPERVATPFAEAIKLLDDAEASNGWLDGNELDALITRLQRFEGWEYQVPGTPKLVVLDTRTRRWRSEKNPKKPSGLMDWEALSDFQQELMDAGSVVIVSPAPMFGVKLIETIQKLFSLAGKPLLVDAENWMAHRGAASVMLNIFRHSRTPGHYVILSGDVHYSFVYDIRIRQRRQGPMLWQITSSGLKNCFPDSLLDTFDRLNRWLYSPRSPLNWFTTRRPMAVRPRDPDRAKAGERLWNGSGIGLVTLAPDGSPEDIRQLDARGMEVTFPPPNKSP